MSPASSVVETTVRVTQDFSQSTYTEQPSSRPFSDPSTGPDLASVVTVLQGGHVVFTADPARVVVSDSAGDCTNQLRVEYIMSGCVIQCNGSSCGQHQVA